MCKTCSYSQLRAQHRSGGDLVNDIASRADTTCLRLGLRSLARFRAGHCVYILRGGACETNLLLSPQTLCKCVRSIARSCAEDIASRAENTCTCAGNVIIHHSAQGIARAFLKKWCCETHALPSGHRVCTCTVRCCTIKR